MVRRQTENPQRMARHEKKQTRTARGQRQRLARKTLEAQLAAQEILVPDFAEVRADLTSHPDLAKIVPSVCAAARNEFGPEAELTLQVYRDPEIDDRHLTLYVRLPSYEHDIIARLERVTQPFEEKLCSAEGYLLVTTDLSPPRVKHGV
jgi:hypothetical protein